MTRKMTITMIIMINTDCCCRCTGYYNALVNGKLFRFYQLTVSRGRRWPTMIKTVRRSTSIWPHELGHVFGHVAADEFVRPANKFRLGVVTNAGVSSRRRYIVFLWQQRRVTERRRINDCLSVPSLCCRNYRFPRCFPS